MLLLVGHSDNADIRWRKRMAQEDSTIPTHYTVEGDIHRRIYPALAVNSSKIRRNSLGLGRGL